MAKKIQLWGFTFIASNVNEYLNVLTNSGEECNSEIEIPCFDGLAYFMACGRYYVISYPKLSSLNEHQKSIIEDYCGYAPSAGEYGVVAGALGICIETDRNTFEYYMERYPISKKNLERLGW